MPLSPIPHAFINVHSREEIQAQADTLGQPIRFHSHGPGDGNWYFDDCEVITPTQA